eukprot:7113048-Prorocentrum_lima.AAC.1
MIRTSTTTNRPHRGCGCGRGCGCEWMQDVWAGPNGCRERLHPRFVGSCAGWPERLPHPLERL